MSALAQGAINLARKGGPAGCALTLIACFTGNGGRETPDASDAGTRVAVEAGAVADGSPWPVSTATITSVSMDDVTVFAFSQVASDTSDPQVTVLGPDMNIRAWQRWDTSGRTASECDAAYVTACHEHKPRVRFIGGTTATALFQDESPTQFDGWVTRDATDALVPHPIGTSVYYRGSLANPSYRDYIVRIGKAQIDLDVDGLFFDEVNGDYQGANYDGDEGFDDDHIADFNAYLLARYPMGTDFQSLFDMTADNILRRTVPAENLTKNFNYRTYLATHGWAESPFASANPLAPVWGKAIGNRPAPGAPTFTDSAEPYVYWKEIVAELRAYAKDTYDRSIYITSNGIWPFVDFQSIGLYDGNTDGPGGTQADYVPLANGGLAGSTSLQSVFVSLKARSQEFAPSVPVVLFIDWPSGPMSRYQGLSRSQKEDYWRIYGAEAYANGLFFAFFLADTTGDPTATEAGLMPFFQSQVSFYRRHASLYHDVTASDAKVTTSLPTTVPGPMLSVGDQVKPHRRIVHIVNHDYAMGFNAHAGVSVMIAVDGPPTGVTLASPDTADPREDATLDFTYSEKDRSVSTTIPSLVAYAAIIVAY